MKMVATRVSDAANRAMFIFFSSQKIGQRDYRDYLDAAGREDRVYVTTDLMQAINCARIMHGMVYRVHPIGRLGPDEQRHRRTGLHTAAGADLGASRRAVVVVETR
jgi:hypothetical protein